MAKAEISWKRRTETGERVEVLRAARRQPLEVLYARPSFRTMAGRRPIRLWKTGLELLDAIRRRINRRCSGPKRKPA